MKKLILLSTLVLSLQANANVEMCHVKVCNKLSRFTLNIWSHVKDSIGKTCWDQELPKAMAVKGKKLASKSKWYQGSFNPTKRSKTWVAEVYKCKTLGVE